MAERQRTGSAPDEIQRKACNREHQHVTQDEERVRGEERRDEEDQADRAGGERCAATPGTYVL
jgi:hypothetical protein